MRERLAPKSFDLLFVNAGVKNDDRETISDVSTEDFVRVMVTNALSPLRVVEAFDDLVREDGTIGLMTSGQGSIANNQTGGYEVYRGSKAALNMFVRTYAARHRDDARTLLLMAPGVGPDRYGRPRRLPDHRGSTRKARPSLSRSLRRDRAMVNRLTDGMLRRYRVYVVHRPWT